MTRRRSSPPKRSEWWPNVRGASGITRIVQGKAGPVMAAAGVDASNTGGARRPAPAPPRPRCRMPRPPRRAPRRHRGSRCSRWSSRIPPVDRGGRVRSISRWGRTGCGVLDDLRGSVDADGRALEVTARAVADEIAAAADLVKGKAAAIPGGVGARPGGFGASRGWTTVRERGRPTGASPQAGASPQVGASRLVRVGDGDWFALGSQEAVSHGPRSAAGSWFRKRARTSPRRGGHSWLAE
jgi:coenzyme F420-0:L-glutamate ligase/coenzyme F420-1:gamma-L-glutamate ligase